ncbi:recombination regulator RecX [Testudinibacter sp. P80/BLE/0925]|uniref:recombination regulator RecX n=1 Tax=Testudinibacter sp. TW-1 TaxID=3417757 RepID=UPI003D3632FE
MNKIALAYIMNLLARRDYSCEEIRQKMTAKAFAAEDIETVLQHCRQKGWQSDQRFCEHFLLSRSRKGYGPARIKQELQQKGIASDLISAQFAQTALDWFELAESVFQKKFSNIQTAQWDMKQKQKAWRFMSNHGFQPDHFRHLFKLDSDDD